MGSYCTDNKHNSDFHSYSSLYIIKVIIRKLWDERVMWHARDRYMLVVFWSHSITTSIEKSIRRLEDGIK
jgi:hypothetical protein